MHNKNSDVDYVDSVFYYSPSPLPDITEKPSKPKFETKEAKPPRKVTPLKMSKLKKLLKKYFDECDVPLNRFNPEQDLAAKAA